MVYQRTAPTQNRFFSVPTDASSWRFEINVRGDRVLPPEREREHCKVRLNIQACGLMPPVELGLGAPYGPPARGTNAATLLFRAHR